MNLAGSLRRSLAVAVVAAAMTTATAHAATITFTSSDAAWQVPGEVERLKGEGTNRISWGAGLKASGGRQSAYAFRGINPGTQVGMGQLVTLGRFTHNNRTIQLGQNLRRANLDFDLGFAVDLGGSLYQEMLSFDWLFKHRETANRAQPCANGKPNGVGLNRNGCADRITFNDRGSSLLTFNYAEGIVTLDVLGFSNGSSFWTVENRRNTTDLLARFSYTPAPIPLPATGWLMLGALAGLAALRRRSSLRGG